MGYFVIFAVGLFCGALAVWLLIMGYFEKGRQSEESAKKTLEKAKSEAIALRDRELELSKAQERDKKEFADAVRQKESELAAARERYQKELTDFQSRVVSYKEIQHENTLLKRDLQNMDVTTNKLEMDGQIRQKQSDEIDDRSKKLASRYLAETVKSVVSAVGPNNFSACKQKLADIIARCREIGFPVSAEEETKLIFDLQREFEKEVRAAFQREEQARIKAKIREEDRAIRERDRILQQTEREKVAIQAALDQALAQANGAHSIQVNQLKARLAEAEEKSQRAISLAQQTRQGHVYVISNFGTFGPDVFKVGMTRRLEPQDRVDELSSASVPFPFDVHMMIWTNDAPALENALHRALHKHRINKANPRKEFFRSTFDEIQKLVVAQGGEVKFVADPVSVPPALEYHQSQSMSDEDAAYIDAVFNKVEAETAGEDTED